jgi:hypothetical protein
MRLDHLRDYLTLREVALRWKATTEDICRGILKGTVKPCLYVNASLRPIQAAESADDAQLGGPEPVLGWHYITPIEQIGALDCIASTVAITPTAIPGVTVWALEQPLSMQDIMRDAVVMREDLEQAEAEGDAGAPWQQRSAKTKEMNSVLALLSIVLADCYRFDPRGRSSTLREITEAGVQFGISVSGNTVAKWAKEAIAQFPPAYMSEPVKQEPAEHATAEMN